MAHGHAVIQIEGRADGDGEFAHAHLGGIAELGRDEFFAFGINLDDGHVGLLIDPAHLGVELAAVLEADFDFVSAVHHMAVGQEVAFLADDHAGTLAVEDGFLAAGTILALFFLLLFPEPLLEFLRQQIEERILLLVEFGVVRLVRHADDHDALRNAIRNLDKGLVELPGDFECG